MLAPGDRLGPYEISAKLGEGGMGEVYRAKDARLGREVAIKVLPQEVSADPERLRRFEHEARAASALNHPGILTVHDFGSEGSVAYLVTELLEGESLRERLRHGAIPEREALALGAEIARALAVAHGKGIVHRDLKPENLFLTRDGRIKILDFGLARWAPPVGPGGELRDATTIAGMTEAGMVLGTVGYMAPEQARGIPVDARADLFALGCVLFEMLAGQRAFDRASAIDTLAAILHEDPLATPAPDGALPEELVRVLRHCLEKDPTRRFQSASDVAFALEGAREGSRPGGGASSSSPANAPTIPKHRWLLPVAIAGVVLAATFAVVLTRSRGPAVSAESPRVSSIAVLPFVNLSSDAEQEYFSDGLSVELIGLLGKVEGLRVIGSTTSFAFKGKSEDLAAIGQKLRVATVLEGSVRKSGDRLRISAELTRASDSTRLWGETYDRVLTDVFAVQAEIARAVVAALEVRLLPGASLVVAGHRTTSPEAYEAFLRGTYFWKRRSREGLEKAVAEFERAIRLDPTYAPARVGLASALIVASTWQFLPSGEAYPRARGEVDRAIELDPNLAEAYAARASIEWDTWKFDAVERDFRRAIALDGNLASAHQWFGEFLGQQAGRPEESIREATLAVEIDPLSLIANSSLGWMLMLAGQNEKAIQQLRATLEMEPEFAPARLFLADAYAAAGAFPEADTQLDLAARAGASATDVDGRRAQFAARSGRPEEARRLLRGLEALPSAEADGAVAIAGVYALLGENDATFAWLERAFRARVPSLGHLGSQAAFAKVRSDRRYARLLERIEPP